MSGFEDRDKTADTYSIIGIIRDHNCPAKMPDSMGCWLNGYQCPWRHKESCGLYWGIQNRENLEKELNKFEIEWKGKHIEQEQ